MRVTMNKETPEAIDYIFNLSLKFYEKDIAKNKAIEIIANKYGTNKGSCDMYIRIICCMLDGLTYKRNMSATATDNILRNISSRLSEDYLKKALDALSGHIHYYENQKATHLKKLRAIYDKWSPNCTKI